uniref:Uncharacterized protein n=1 Tax=Anguilla anguilla TaxID=7936 RepID=A0A0E9T430_ANGAN
MKMFVNVFSVAEHKIVFCKFTLCCQFNVLN